VRKQKRCKEKVRDIAGMFDILAASTAIEVLLASELGKRT
jgi:hypothetical protein